MQQNFPTFFKNITVLFLALLAGQVMVALVLYFVVPRSYMQGEDWLLLLPELIVFPAIGWWIHKKRITAARELTDLSDKAEIWRAASILRWAMSEGITLICLVLYFFNNGHVALLGLAGINLVYFTFLRPSRANFVRDLELTTTEEMQLDDPNFLISTPPPHA